MQDYLIGLGFEVDLSLCDDKTVFYSKDKIGVEMYESYAIVSIMDVVHGRDIRLDVHLSLSENDSKIDTVIERLTSAHALLIGLLAF